MGKQMFVGERVVETGFSFSQAVPAPPERRQDQRLLRILRVGTLIVDDRRELCLIRNISAGGLNAHVYSSLVPGQKVSVELKTHHPISGHVIWTDDANAGVKFDVPVDVSELLANPGVLENGWRPRTPRVEIDRMGTLRAGARTHWVHARDISQSGVKVETDRPPERGTEVVLTLEGFRPLPGVVRWTSDAECGLVFNQLIPFGELIDWLKNGN
jgi:hypothetical protein